jgi:transcriptional regulator with XRE-family HTH domain
MPLLRPRQPTLARDLIGDLLAIGMTRSQIANRTGLSPAYITALRQGDRGKRIGLSAYVALQGLAEASLPEQPGAESSARQPAGPRKWTRPGR